MAAIPNRIVIGNDQSNPLFVFENNAIIEVNSDTSVSLIGEELYIDQFDCTVDYFVWEPYLFKPTDYDGFMSSDDYLLCSKQNYDIRLLPYGTKIVYYSGGAIAGTYYVKTVERLQRAWYKISAISALGLLDKQYHRGGIYTGQYLQDVIEEIIGADYDYVIDGTVAVQTVYGWLPYDTRRNNLYQVLFAYGVEIVTGDNGSMFFTFPDKAPAAVVPASRVFTGGKIIYDEPASRVEVSEHSYHYDPANEEVTLFDNSSDAAVEDTMVIFDQPIYPASIYCAEGSLTIGSTHANFAIVSGVGVLKGIPYVHNARVITQENENAPVEKVVTVTDATLVSFVSADNVLARLSEYYFNAQRVEQDIRVEGEKPGKLYTTQDPFNQLMTGYISRMTKSVTSFARARCRFIKNYEPTGAGAAYTNRIVIPLGPGASQTWTIPEYVFTKEVPAIRITLIGKGQDGADGADGENAPYENSKAARGGAGGLGGAGGPGGNIFTFTLLATGLTELTVYNDGIESSLTSLYYNFSSADGAPSRFGYFDILTQEVFAHPGEDGVDGAAGGNGDYYPHNSTRGDTSTPGGDVVYKGVTYVGGETGERSIVPGSYLGISSNITVYISGRGGGGAAAGANGNAPVTSARGYTGPGGIGADAVAPDQTSSAYGSGGNGGHGGGGGGAIAIREYWNQTYSSTIAIEGSAGNTPGGKGSAGTAGNYGCAIIYY